MTEPEKSVSWGGKLVGKGDWPLGNADDCRMWLVGAFGLAVYAAKGYVIAIQGPNQYDRFATVDPGSREFRRFLQVMERARAYANRRRQ